MEINQEDLSEERYSDEEEEIEEDSQGESYSDEIIDEFSIELHPMVPQTFEDFSNMYRSEPSENLNQNFPPENATKLPVEVQISALKPKLEVETSQEIPEDPHDPEDIDYYPDSEEEIEEEIEEEQEISGRSN
jgi:hypothetical protein